MRKEDKYCKFIYLYLCFHCYFKGKSDSLSKEKKWDHANDIAHRKVMLYLGPNSKLDEIWSMFSLLVTMGIAESEALGKEGITLEILFLKNDLNLVLTYDSWGGVFCQRSLLFQTRKASTCLPLVLPQVLGIA